jgi:hypothetical protein
LDEASVRARRIVEGLPRAILGVRADQASWSVAECLAHLTLTSNAYLPVIGQALEEGRRRGLVQSGRGFRMGVAARMLAWWMEPPYRLRSRTPAAFVPAVDDPADALPQFLDRQQKLLNVVADADGLAIDRLLIASPFASRVRYSVYAAFRLIAVHERRHLWQAEQTVRKLGLRQENPA